MPKLSYDISKPIYSLKRDSDGNARPFSIQTGFEEGKPVMEDATFGGMLQQVLTVKPEGADDKGGKKAFADYQLGLDIELALRNGNPKVEIDSSYIEDLKKRVDTMVEKEAINRFIGGQLWNLLENAGETTCSDSAKQ